MATAEVNGQPQNLIPAASKPLKGLQNVPQLSRSREMTTYWKKDRLKYQGVDKTKMVWIMTAGNPKWAKRN